MSASPSASASTAGTNAAGNMIDEIKQKNVSIMETLPPFSWRMFFIYNSLFFFFGTVGFTIIPLAQKINIVFNGDQDTTSATSSTLAITINFLQNGITFLMSRYTCAMSDYIGRKPILILTCAGYSISRFFYVTATNEELLSRDHRFERM